MTKKDYVLIAKAINGTRPIMFPDRTFNDTVDVVARAISWELMLDNAAFNRQRFLEACGDVDYKK